LRNGIERKAKKGGKYCGMSKEGADMKQKKILIKLQQILLEEGNGDQGVGRESGNQSSSRRQKLYFSKPGTLDGRSPESIPRTFFRQPM
jgi:hypothetical protein